MPHDTLEIRFYRMVAHKENLNPFFQQTKGISERRGKFYLDWQRVLWNSIREASMRFQKGTLRRLVITRGYTKRQVKQNREAVLLYIEKFWHRNIVF
jgi:truncated hemoglobin YjbI